MKYLIGFTFVVAVVLGPARADAQQLTLAIRDGRVSLDARNVPVRQILREGARVGGAVVVNGDKIAGPAVTLHLANEPERRALDVILRGVSGYMLAARQPGGAGASMFDRILILPTSTAVPASGAVAGSAPRNTPGSQAAAANTFARPIIAVPPPVPDQDQDDAGAPEADAPAPVRRIPRRFPFQPPGAPTGVTTPLVVPQVPASGNPFGSPTGSGRPGVVVPGTPGAPASPATVGPDGPPVPEGLQTR